MADIQYLSYGNLQVEKLALLNLMADSVTTYVNKLPWSRKRKEKFISAYSDMLSRGILGASSDSGQWVVNVNGEIDLESKSKKDKLMYQEAAWFIRHQMLSLAQDKDKKENETEVIKTPFDFNKDFINYVSKQKFGSNDFKTSQWNEFDERNKYGIRGTGTRMKMLSELLQSYSDNFDESKFDFKDSPYENSADLKKRIGEAITALGTPDKRDDLEKLYAIGLDPADWFNNGSGDPSGYVDSEGNPLTYGQYYDITLKAYILKYKDYVENLKKYREKLDNITSNLTIQPRVILSASSSTPYNYNTAGLVADISSMLGDIASLAGGPVGVGGGLWSLGSDLVGDIIKGKSFGDVTGNALGNLLWTAAGVIPGARTGKLIKTISRIYAAAAPVIMAQNPSILKTWKKLLSGNFNLSNEDIENVKLTMHAITGGANAARGARTDRQVTARVKNTTGEIRLTNGETKTLNKEHLADVIRIGNRKGQKAAMDKAKEYLGLKEGENIAEGQFNFSEKGSRWYQPSYFSLRYRDNVGTRWYIPGRSRADIIDLNKVQQLRTLLATLPNRSFRSAFTRNSDKFFSRVPKLEMSLSLNRYLPRDLQLNTFGIGRNYRNLFKVQELSKPSEVLITEFKETLKGLNFGINDPKNANFDILGLGNVDFKVDDKGSTLRIRLNNGTVISLESSALDNVKLNNLRVIKENLRKIDEQLPKEQETKINIELINKLKEVGALKQGGRIDKLKIQKYKEYILK